MKKKKFINKKRIAGYFRELLTTGDVTIYFAEKNYFQKLARRRGLEMEITDGGPIDAEGCLGLCYMLVA